MVVAKSPGVGRGKGGGRPKREGERLRVAGLDLSPRAAELLRAAAQAKKVPAWQIVERAILAMEGASIETTSLATPGPNPGHALPPEVLEIALEAATFLEAAKDRPRAIRALRRAWAHALALARHDLTPPDPSSHPSD